MRKTLLLLELLKKQKRGEFGNKKATYSNLFQPVKLTVNDNY